MNQNENEYVLRVEDLTYTYSIGTPFERTAVDSVSIDIKRGEFIGIIGHTGSGKSTLIQHLNGLLKPTSGKVIVDGTDIWENKKTDKREIRFKVGVIFQYPEYQLFEETVYKDIAYGPGNMGLSNGEIKDRVMMAMDFVGLDESFMEKSPFELSGGQKRRVAIAGVIAMQPKVLVLDEPAAGLDPQGRAEIMGNISGYHKKEMTTIVLVSHYMEDIAAYASRVLCMKKGEVFLQGTVDEVFAQVDQLSENGLSVPQITRLFNKLRERGINIDGNVYTVGQAKEAIFNYIKNKENRK